MPTKRRATPDELQKLIEKYDIQFKGPVPPENWPPTHGHLFKAIRKIWDTREDKYSAQSDSGSGIRRKHRNRAGDIRNDAYNFRDNLTVVESTWRHHIDVKVLDRFVNSAKCDVCKGERWSSDFEAVPLNDDEAKKLHRKRAQRSPCEGHLADDEVDSRVGESDDEEVNGAIFDRVTDGELLQNLELQNESMTTSMRPDVVMGLRATKQLKQYLAFHPPNVKHDPFVGHSTTLYPFLLIEAKQGKGPGFRFTENQSAFPLYKLLKLQDSLRKRSNFDFEPLVWFFGYQGDIWRLYAATLEGNGMRVFDLWIGTIESWDGSLQLMQISDFIWTWARDIYRPCIERCLSGNHESLQSQSPMSSDVLSGSQSVSSVITAQYPVNGLQEHVPNSNAHTITLDLEERNSTISDAASHSLHRWYESRVASSSWASHTAVRHSNVVASFFRVLELPTSRNSLESFIGADENDRQREKTLSHLLPLLQQSQYSLPLTRSEVLAVGREWIGTDLSSSSPSQTSPDEVLMAFFFFRTVVRREDWQVTRGIYCIMWSLQTAQALSRMISTDVRVNHAAYSSPTCAREVLLETLRVRDLAGITSVQMALKETTLVLSHSFSLTTDTAELQWSPPPGTGITAAALIQYREFFRAASSGMHPFFGLEHRADRLLWTHQEPDGSTGLECAPPVPAADARKEALIASKPETWPFQSPRFCLYVFKDNEVDGRRLRELLRTAIENNDWYDGVGAGAGPLQFSDSDVRILQAAMAGFTQL